MNNFNKINYLKLQNILRSLSENIKPKIELNAGYDAYVLLISVVLSAQATDVSVNKILPDLFKNINFYKLSYINNNLNIMNNILNYENYKYCYKDYFINKINLKYILSLTINELEDKIKTIGLYRNKAKNIHKLTKILVEKYDYNIPQNLEGLMSLPGVGRKSANIILNVVFDQPTVPVDTHVLRVSNRLGISNFKTPDKVELDIIEYFNIINFSNKLNHIFVYLQKYIFLFQQNKNYFFYNKFDVMNIDKDINTILKLDKDYYILASVLQYIKENFQKQSYEITQKYIDMKMPEILNAFFKNRVFLYKKSHNNAIFVYDKYNLLKNLHFYFVLHGRYICTSRSPKCQKCCLKNNCLFYKNNKH